MSLLVQKGTHRMIYEHFIEFIESYRPHSKRCQCNIAYGFISIHRGLRVARNRARKRIEPIRVR